MQATNLFYLFLFLNFKNYATHSLTQLSSAIFHKHSFQESGPPVVKVAIWCLCSPVFPMTQLNLSILCRFHEPELTVMLITTENWT